MNKSTKGIIYALIASIALANSFIFSKSALNEINFVQFGFFWFLFGTIWNLIYLFSSRKTKDVFKINIEVLKLVGFIAILEALASGLFYIAIQKADNPAIVSFIGSIGPVFVTVMGITILKEKFSISEIAGILLTIAGVFIISYNKSSLSEGILVKGSGYVILASLIFAIATITARKFRENLDPLILALLRASLLFIAFTVLIIISNELPTISKSSLINISIGSMLEGLITMVFAYKALQYIEAAKTSLLISSKSIFVLISAWLFLNVFPENYQLVGGLFTIVGIILLTLKNKTNNIK